MAHQVNDADTRAEYKQVTVLFADVVHSMDIASAVGAKRLREIIAGLVDRAAVVVKRYGGTVDKFTGHGIMAVLGAPIALEITRPERVWPHWTSRGKLNAWRLRSAIVTALNSRCESGLIPAR